MNQKLFIELSFIIFCLSLFYLLNIIPINPTLEQGQTKQMMRGGIVRLTTQNFLLVSMQDT